MMILHVEEATYLNAYRIKLSFNDGRTGIADLTDALKGVFEPLRDRSLFSQFETDRETNTVSWSNGTDMAPEYLYFLAFKDEPELQGKFKKWGYISPVEPVLKPEGDSRSGRQQPIQQINPAAAV